MQIWAQLVYDLDRYRRLGMKVMDLRYTIAFLACKQCLPVNALSTLTTYSSFSDGYILGQLWSTHRPLSGLGHGVASGENLLNKRT